MFLPIFPIPVRTGLTTTHRYPLESGLTTELINTLLNPHIARLNGSIGSLNPDGRTMESPGGLSGTLYGVEFVAVGAVTCAGAAVAARLARAPKSRSVSLSFIVLCDGSHSRCGIFGFGSFVIPAAAKCLEKVGLGKVVVALRICRSSWLFL